MFIENRKQQRQGNRLAWIISFILIVILIVIFIARG